MIILPQKPLHRLLLALLVLHPLVVFLQKTLKVFCSLLISLISLVIKLVISMAIGIIALPICVAVNLYNIAKNSAVITKYCGQK